MNRIRHWTRRAAIVAVAVSTIGGTGGAWAQSPSVQGTEPITLRVGFTYDLYTSNPLRACGCGAEYEWMALNYDMLLNFDKKTMAAAPGLATEVPTKENGGISQDGMVYTFKIREGVTWHDGTPFTSRDVAFTYRFMLDNKIGAFNNYLPFEPTFETPDDTTFIWTMNEPNLSPLAPPFIPILPQHIWERYDGDAFAARRFENIPAIGTGPFQLVEWQEGQFWRMEANPDHWNGAPHVDEIVIRSFDNQEAMALALREGEVDIVSGLIPSLAASLEDAPNVDVHEAEARGFLNLAFNFRTDRTSTAHPALHDLDVRLAIAHAIDRQELVDRVLLGAGSVGTSIVVPSNQWHWEPTPEQVQEYDPDLARSILDEAGYLDTDGDGVREMPDGGEPLQLEILTVNSVSSSHPSGKLIASWLGEIGIDVILRPMSDGRMNEAWTAGTFDAYMWGWNPDPDPDFILSVFTRDQCMNWSDGCYSDPEYDRMYREQQLAAELADRQRIVAQMQEFIYEDVAQVILYYESDLQAYRTDTFTSWTPTPEPDGYFVFGYVPYGYTNVQPVLADDGTQVRNSTNTIPLWAWGAGLTGLILLAVGIVALRRRGEDERI